MNVSALIFIALGLGIAVGVGFNQFFPVAIVPLNHFLLVPLGTAFLRLIQFVVVPIVFSSLVLGLTRIENANQMGRYIVRLLGSYLFTGTIAVGIGVSLELLLQPGAGVTGVSPTMAPTVQNLSLIDWLVGLVPVNPLQALSGGSLLQTILAAALIVGGIHKAGEKSASFLSLVESLYVIFEKVLVLILYTAPIGVFALICSLITTQGFELISKLFVYILGLIIAYSIMMSLYALILGLFKVKLLHFFKSFLPTISLAFGTASSSAALPVALENAQEDYGLPKEIVGFAIPVGAALKHDGSAIFQSFNALFIAQIYHVPLTPNLVLLIAVCTLLISFSAPGVPGAGIILMTTVLNAAGLPLEGVALVAGVDRLTDGFKTVVNVMGNVVNAVILSRWEQGNGQAIDQMMQSEPETLLTLTTTAQPNDSTTP
jgi:Na+/H+-dicarboxylate symporter